MITCFIFLDFIRNFLAELYKLEDQDKLQEVCKETYNRTLAQYHTWIIRNAATLAMHLLPTKQDLVKKVISGKTKINQ